MMMVKESWSLSSWCCTKSQATVSRKVSSCVCVWEILFLCRVCYAPKQICPYQRHGRHSGYHGDWVWVAAKLPFSHVLFVFCVRILRASVQVCVCVSIYNTRSFTLSDSLGVYSYPLSFGSQTRLRLQLELKSVQCGRQSGGMEKRGWGVATWRSYASCCMHFVCW